MKQKVTLVHLNGLPGRGVSESRDMAPASFSPPSPPLKDRPPLPKNHPSRQTPLSPPLRILTHKDSQVPEWRQKKTNLQPSTPQNPSPKMVRFSPPSPHHPVKRNSSSFHQRKDSSMDRRSPVSKPSSPQPERASGEKFSRAFTKSLITRTRNLNRRLTRAEFLQLSASVRRQISRKFSRVDMALSTLQERIVRLEHATPQSPLELQDSIGMFAAQVSVLREQALQAISERDEISEGCSHFSKKKIFTAKIEDPNFVITAPGLEPFQPRVSKTETLACRSCTQKREEAVFYWTGCSMTSFQSILYTPADYPIIESAGLRNIPPLSLQSVWSSILTQHFSREWKTPAN